MLPVTIDFEASCLPCRGRSFPIEVGIADAAGNCRSWLIRPHRLWQDWTWAEDAEALHGISRAELERDGRPAWQVLAELGAIAGDRSLIADSWLDADWLATLSEAAGFAPAFRIHHIASILDELSPALAQARKAEERLAAMAFRRHRAAQDARYLALWIAALGEGDTLEKMSRYAPEPQWTQEPADPSAAKGFMLTS